MEAMANRSPLVVADLTWTPVRHGKAVARRRGWDDEHEPFVGEHVLVSALAFAPSPASSM